MRRKRKREKDEGRRKGRREREEEKSEDRCIAATSHCTGVYACVCVCVCVAGLPAHMYGKHRVCVCVSTGGQDDGGDPGACGAGPGLKVLI